MENCVCILKTVKGYELFRKVSETENSIVLAPLAGGRVLQLPPNDFKQRVISMDNLERQLEERASISKCYQ
jgi:hypothetical protein